MGKSFQERLILDEANLKVLGENRKKNISGPALFKQTFFGGLWNMMKTNWFMLVFCLPVLAIYMWGAYQVTANNINVGYSGNIGIGYPAVNNAYEAGVAEEFALKMRYALYMLPTFVVGFAGLAGVFNVVKYFCWGMNVKIIKTFLRGIKNSFVPFVWFGLLFGLCYILLVYAFNVQDISSGLRLLMIIGGFLFMAMLLLLAIYTFTQGAVFNLSMFAMLKNSVLLSGRFILQSLLVLVAGLASIAIGAMGFMIPASNILGMLFQMLLMMIFFMTAFTFLATVWTVYSQSVFDMAYDARKRAEKETPKAIPAPVLSAPLGDAQHSEESKKPSAPQKVQFKNPKKKKK